MKLTWSDLIINKDYYNNKDEEILEEWYWLIGHDKKIVLISSLGDLILKNYKDEYFWLDTGGGEFKKVANSENEFEEKINNEEIRDEWFLIELVRKIKSRGIVLKEGYLFGYKKLPIIGGEYNPNNFELTPIIVHFNLSGQIHRQIKDLPDGTEINIEVKN